MTATEVQGFRLPQITGPYPGLRPFESDEEAIFRGRRNQTDELLRRLAGHRFLAVVGTSGSGKSSLVRAGLLPALDRGYLAGATSRWRIAVMRPGMAPIENLAEALRGSGPQQAAIQSADAATLRSSSLGLVEAVRKAGLTGGESLLVVADQFEELFRYFSRMFALDGGSEAAHFVNLLLAAGRRPDAPVYVVLTMRSDFLGDCSQFPGLPEALSESQYLIPRLAREERRQAIVEPLRLFGATMTPQLIEQLLNDSGDEPGDLAAAGLESGSRYRGGAPDPLPVLQHALLRTWLEWRALPQHEPGEPIDLLQYQSAGRMEAALNQHAERLFNEELDNEGRRWAERIFRCLTTTELGRPIRRPTPLADLYTIIGSKDEDRGKVDQVLGLFRRRDNSFVQLNRDGSVDISHESLIWKWKRLNDWVTDEAAGADLYRDLVKDATGKATWGEPKLSSALAVRDRNAWNPDWARQYSEAHFQDVKAFLARSQRAMRRQRLLRSYAVAFPVMILAAVAYYSTLQTRQKAKELATVQIAEVSLAREQEALKEQIEGLNAARGAAQEDRDRIAEQTAVLQEQLSKSQQDSQKLAAQAQQSSTDQLANVKTLQSQRAAAQHDRDDAVKARQDADAKSAQLAKSLATAQDERDAAVKARQLAEAKSAQPAKTPESAPAVSTIPEPAPAVADKAAAAPTQAEKRMTNPKDGLTYVFIPAGKFAMGCSPGDKQCNPIEKNPPQLVQIPDGFWLGQTEVTQAAWKKVNRGGNPSHFKGDQLPVESVNWKQASDYCKAIGGRLPSEQEWEYAARAGTTGPRYGALDDVAWHAGNSGATTHPVGRKQPNAFGLHDMLGNVGEWTDTDYDTGAKVVRGGSWYSDSWNVRASYRLGSVPSDRNDVIGFRCVGELR